MTEQEKKQAEQRKAEQRKQEAEQTQKAEQKAEQKKQEAEQRKQSEESQKKIEEQNKQNELKAKELEEQTRTQQPDDKGHLPSTPVPTHPGVVPGQIVNKGGSVLTTQEPGTVHSDQPKPRDSSDKPDQSSPQLSAVPTQIARAAKPTLEDTRAAMDRPGDQVFKQLPPEEQRPERRALLQTENRVKELEELEEQSEETTKEKFGDTERPKRDPTDGTIYKNMPFRHRQLSGMDDASIPGSRSGDPLENQSESHLGDKVHHVLPGGMRLEVQSHDKATSIPVNRAQLQGQAVKRRKVSLLFPGINPEVAQRELTIFVQVQKPADDPTKEPTVENWEPSVEVFPPDVPNKEILLPAGARIHIELVHVSQEGHRSHPYMLDFYCDPRVTPRPLEASPIGFEIMEEVLTASPIGY